MSGTSALLGAGFLLGLSVAAPLGPVGAAAIREGLERGFLGAFLLGLGAAAVDFFYLALVYAGLAPLLLALPGLMTLFYAAGALLLARMAYGALRQAYVGSLPAPHGSRRGERNAFLYGLGITLLNPATILSWLGLGGAFAAAYLTERTFVAALLILISVFAGSAAWFTVLAAAASGARRLAGNRPWVLRAVNGAAGLALGAFALSFLTRAITGK